jgi:hypothetical protein
MNTVLQQVAGDRMAGCLVEMYKAIREVGSEFPFYQRGETE